jgi:hydrogenase nickel incorporation protein HypA/HybF
MHELSIAHAIVEMVTDQAEGKRVTRVVVEIGKLAAVFPDALRFGFEVASEGTSASGASLEVIETAGEELRVRQMEVV